MSFARVQGREEPITEQTFSHHVLPAANEFCHPYETLAGCETELNLDVMKNLKGATIETIGRVAGYFYDRSRRPRELSVLSAGDRASDCSRPTSRGA